MQKYDIAKAKVSKEWKVDETCGTAKVKPSKTSMPFTRLYESEVAKLMKEGYSREQAVSLVDKNINIADKFRDDKYSSANQAEPGKE